MKSEMKKMDALVSKFVQDVTELTQEMAREALLNALGGNIVATPKPKRIIDKAVKKITKATKKVTKKVAKKTVAKVQRTLKDRQKDAKRAWRMREKVKVGKKLDDKSKAWLDKYTKNNSAIALGHE